MGSSEKPGTAIGASSWGANPDVVRLRLRVADNELHDALAAATCVKELRFVAISLFWPFATFRGIAFNLALVARLAAAGGYREWHTSLNDVFMVAKCLRSCAISKNPGAQLRSASIGIASS